EVRTYRTGEGRLWADTADKPAPVLVTSGPLADLAPRLIVGRLPASPDADEVVVSEFALYQLGVRDDDELDAVLGRAVRLDVGGFRNAQPLALARALIGQKPPEELTRGQMQALEKITHSLPQKIDLFDLSAAEKLELQKLLAPPAEPTEERPHESGKTASGTYRICGAVRLMTREEKKKMTPLDPWELINGDAFLPPATGGK